MNHDQIRAIELAKKLTAILKKTDIETGVTGLSMCLGFALGTMDEAERKSCRAYIDKTIKDAIAMVEHESGKWGVLLGYLMAEM